MAWLLAQAERIARRYGSRALSIVRTTAQAIVDLTEEATRRNFAISINGHTFTAPSWLPGVASLVGRIGLDVGELAVAPHLAALGITGDMVGAVEHELNHDGLSLGPLAKAAAPRAATSVLGAIGGR